MPDYIIKITDDEDTIFQKIASQSAITVEVYINNLVKGWIVGQMRGIYLDYVKKAPITTLKTVLDAEIDKVK